MYRNGQRNGSETANPEDAGIVRVRTAISKFLYDIVLINRKLFRAPLFLGQFALGRRFNRQASRAVKRILLVRLQRLGDLMMTKPVISALHEEYPGATIDIITASSVRILQQLFAKEIDNWYSYESSLYQPRASARAERAALRRSLRQYDLVIDFDGDFFTLNVARALKPNRYLSRGLTRISEAIHHRERRDAQLELLFMIAGVEWREKEQSGMRTAVRQRLIEVHPFSGAGIRDPEPQFWRELIAELQNTFDDYQIMLTGYGKEEPVVAALAEETRSNVYADDSDVLHQRFRQNVALVICPDTFTMHFAAHLGTPVIALFGPQSPARYCDFYPTVHPIYHPVACSPCGYNNFGIDFCPREKRCLRSITVTEVVQKAEELLRDSH